MLRCKSCGYVIEAGRVGEVCPACGVPRRMMEAWKDPVSDRRRLYLWLDVHPIVAHFTVAFSASAFVLSLVVLIGLMLVGLALSFFLEEPKTVITEGDKAGTAV